MDKDEVLGKLKDVINSLIKDNPEDPENAKEGHADAATAALHDVITAKMRERVAGAQAPADTDDDEGAAPTAAPAAAPIPEPVVTAAA